MDPFAREDDEIAAQMLENIAPVIALGDRIKLAAKQISSGKYAYSLDDFDVVSLYIMCDFAEVILEKIAPALEEGCTW